MLTGKRDTYIKSLKDLKANTGTWGPWLLTAVFITMSGFVLQFVGLRAMYSSIVMA